ncbi:unnamed protein product [Spirodela intermedia]|uniref:Fe2OG dioxygenase domain-containing protein n=1 Tax=Spirodela intermedia TaxID=51605 RepID=A0A7I8KJM9_SPIIN|nr:unnamed protein product [Spirodela intermedia]
MANGGVKALSESGAEPPLEFVLQEAVYPSGDASRRRPADIPIVDLLRLPHYDDETAKLRSAIATWGAFQAAGHGISFSLLEDVRSVGRRFFELPPEEKLRCSSKSKGFGEGYGRDQVKAQTLDWSDRILLKVYPEDQRSLELWPRNPTSFSQTLHEYVAKVNTVAQLIIEAMARSIGLDETHFIAQLGEEREIYCRFSYYPPCQRPDLVLGLKPHSDNSAITMILQDGDVEGLELLSEDGGWVSVPSNPDVLLVVVGDLMEIMSNGSFKSPVHRVVINSNKDRISASLFFAMKPEKLIGPAEGLLKEEGKQRLYRDLIVKDYLDAHLNAFEEGKQAINWARV